MGVENRNQNNRNLNNKGHNNRDLKNKTQNNRNQNTRTTASSASREKEGEKRNTKEKVYLLCVGMALMVANFTIVIGNIYINILPGFIGCILFFPLSGNYCRESILARGLRVLSVCAAAYAAVVYFMTAFSYAAVSTTWWGMALSFFETSLDLILCYLFLLSLLNAGTFRKIDADGTHTAMVWFWLMAISAVGVYFCSGVMAVVCRLIQCVAAVLYAVFASKAIIELDKEKGHPKGGKSSAGWTKRARIDGRRS